MTIKAGCQMKLIIIKWKEADISWHLGKFIGWPRAVEAAAELTNGQNGLMRPEATLGMEDC